MNQPVLKTATRYVICLLLTVAITAIFFKILHPNSTTVAMSFLVVVLAVSTVWGLRPAVFTSVLATLAINFFFLPPLLTFTIADPRNWASLFAFLATSVIASQLAERARRKAEEANQRRSEVERLYDFSQQLLLTDNIVSLLNDLPRRMVESFGIQSAALYVAGRDRIYRSAPDRQSLTAEEIREAAHKDEASFYADRDVCLAPVRMGLRSIGSVGLMGNVPSRETVDAIDSLIAIAIERAGAVEQLGRTQAARESERLRSALLDAVTHDFRTPLTALKASISTLRAGHALTAEQREDLLAVIDEEADRLNRLVGEAVEMAQLDADQVQLDLQRHNIREAIQAVIGDSKESFNEHPIVVRLPDQLPPARMDLIWITKVLRHLLENAAKYSSPASPIFISANVSQGQLVTSIADQGAGIDELERSLIFDKFYRGQGQRQRVAGTGMGLAIVKAIVQAHGGTIEVTSQLGQGSVFSFSLPLAIT